MGRLSTSEVDLCADESERDALFCICCFPTNQMGASKVWHFIDTCKPEGQNCNSTAHALLLFGRLFSFPLPFAPRRPRLIVNETLKSLNCCSNPGEISIFVAQMMRKSATLLLSFLLSTMIVWIGSGILTVVCEHTGNVSLASVPSKKHCNTADDGHCMKLQMKTLSPTDMAPTGIHQVLPVQLSLLPQLLTLPQLLPLPILAKVPGRMSPLLWHGSARQYLRMLTTLLI